MILTLEINTAEELLALYTALGQYCDNQKDYLAGEDNPSTAELNRLSEVEKYLNQFDSLFAKLAG